MPKMPTPGGTPKMPKMAMKTPPMPKGTVRGMPSMSRGTTPRVPRVPKV